MKTKGLVIGKFYPPHKGHHYLINFALDRVDELDVLICDNPRYNIPAKTRAEWLSYRHPRAKVAIIPDIGQDDDSRAWANHTQKFLGYTPNVVFTSEDYGHDYAKYLGASHFLVDKNRTHVPIAARRIRANVLKNWEYLAPEVRAKFCRRICVLGAESTGTTTLSRSLAKHYGVPWVPEYGRLYSESLMYKPPNWKPADFEIIARQQQALEDVMAGESDGLIICDTNAYATRLWEERYIGSISKAVNDIAAQTPPDIYLLTDVDIPFVQDGIRDGQHIRHDMHQRFIDELEQQTVPYFVLSGSVNGRTKQAIKIIDELMKEPKTI